MAQKSPDSRIKKFLSANSELIGWVFFGVLIISIYQFSSRFTRFHHADAKRNCRGGPILNFRNYHIRAYQILFIIKGRLQNIAKKRLSSTNCALYDRANFTRVRMWQRTNCT